MASTDDLAKIDPRLVYAPGTGPLKPETVERIAKEMAKHLRLSLRP